MAMNHKVKIGYAPTRRRIFSVEDALKYKKLIADKLTELKIEFVDIEDINEEGLLRCAEDVAPVIKKFKEAEVDAVFFPHCNFGSEHSCGKVARALGVPVLLWGPRDEAPLEDGSRLRDSQCGLFATGKGQDGITGLFYGGGFTQLGIQLVGLFAIIAYTAIVMSIVFLVLKKTIGLRVSATEELEGLDSTEHGLETAYSGFIMNKNL